MWDLRFRLHQDNGQLLPGLRIKDTRDDEYLDLTDFDRPLDNYNEFSGLYGLLIGEDQGWELDIPFKTQKELINLVDLFLRKAGIYLYDEDGNELEETEYERKERALGPMHMIHLL